MYATAGASNELAVTLPPADRAAFRAVISKGVESVEMALSRIDLERAEAFSSDDRSKIFAAVKAGAGGFDGLNARVAAILRAWLLREAKHAADANPSDSQLIRLVGDLYTNLDQQRAAIAAYERCLSVADSDERTAGDADRRAGVKASGRQGIANAYYAARDLDKAEAAYTSALEALGPDDLPGSEFRLLALGGLANVLDDTGRAAEAEPKHREVLALREKMDRARPDDDGLDTDLTAGTCINLGSCLLVQGRPADALELFNRARVALERIWGPDYREALVASMSAASALDDLGRNEEAIALLRRTLKGFEKSAGVEHHQTLGCTSNLAISLLRAGQFAEAKRLLDRVVEARVRLYGQDHPLVVSASKNLAYCERQLQGAADLA